MATAGALLQRHTGFLNLVFRIGSEMDRATYRVYADRLSRSGVCACGQGHLPDILAPRNTRGARHPEMRRATVPIRALFGVRDTAVHRSFAAPKPRMPSTTRSRRPDASHFIIDERPDLVRARLIALAEETAA